MHVVLGKSLCVVPAPGGVAAAAGVSVQRAKKGEEKEEGEGRREKGEGRRGREGKSVSQGTRGRADANKQGVWATAVPSVLVEMERA